MTNSRVPIRILLVLAGLALAAGPATGQEDPTRQHCQGPEHRAFDFWLGDWEVTANGQVAGTNRITLVEDGCVLHEQWTGGSGGTGQSFNFFDRTTGQWHQVWVDNSGNVLRLAGTFEAGSLRYRGTVPRPGGALTHHRLGFTPNPDGSVRQLWEVSTDGEATWRVVFDGLYRKRAP